MAKKCIFCPQPANSAEDIWSSWILEELKPSQPIRITRGKIKSEWIDDPRVRVKCVCKKCNNEWMSDIENENKPHMLPMINGKPAVLEPKKQKLLTRWAILKAMVIDGSSKSRKPFYDESDRANIKPPLRAIPVGTLTWTGRLAVKSFHVGVFDTYGEIGNVPKAFHACNTIIIVGHLVIQVLTMRVLPMFATGRQVNARCNPGAWNVNLLDIWPALGDKAWPPAFSFTLKGPREHHIGSLIHRWRIGEDITK